MSKKMGKTANIVTITSKEEFAPRALSAANNNLEIFESLMTALGYKKVESAANETSEQVETEEESVSVDVTE